MMSVNCFLSCLRVYFWEYQEIFLLCCEKAQKNVLQGRKPFNSALIWHDYALEIIGLHYYSGGFAERKVHTASFLILPVQGKWT